MLEEMTENHTRRNVPENFAEQVKSVNVVDFARNKLLEDAEERRELVSFHDSSGTTTQVRRQKLNERGNISASFPKRGREQRSQHGKVFRGHHFVESEQLSENLEHVGHEFLNIVGQNLLERREQQVLKLLDGGRVVGADIPNKGSQCFKGKVVEFGVGRVARDGRDDLGNLDDDIRRDRYEVRSRSHDNAEYAW